MKKLLKFFAALVTILAVIVIGALLIVSNFVDPNQFKPLITEKVEEATGKSLTIDGQLSWSLFPTLSVDTGRITLANPAGFNGKDLLSIDQAKLSVKVLPIIWGKIELGDIVIKGLKVNLEKRADGQANWDNQNLPAKFKTGEKVVVAGDGSAKTQTTVAKTAPPKPASVSHDEGTSLNFELAHIPDVDISDVNLHWDDQQTGQKFALQNLNMQLKQAAMSRPFPVSMSFNLAMTKPQLEGRIALSSKLTMNLDDGYYKVDDLDLSAKLKGAFFTNDGVDFKTTGSLTVDKPNEIVKLKDGKISLNKMVASANFEANGYKNKFDGDFNLKPFNLKQLIDELGQTPPKLKSSSALTNVGGVISVHGTKNSVNLSKLELILDKSKLTGEMNITDIQNNKGTFAIKLNKINLDDYTPVTQSAANDEKHGKAGASARGEPRKLTFKADMNGAVDIGKVIVSQLAMTNLHATMVAKDDFISVDPVKADLYKGHINAAVSMNTSTELPRYTVKFDMNDVDIEPLTKDATSGSLFKIFLGDVTGKAHISTNVNTKGQAPDIIKANLNGSGNIAITNGELKGFDLAYFWKLAQAFISSGGHDTGDVKQTGANETEFGTLTASYTIKNGIVRNDDFLMQTPVFRAGGRGEANIPANTINYHVYVTPQRSHKNADGSRSYETTGDALPLIKITGKLDNPDVSLDVGELIKSVAKEGIKKIGDTLKDNVGSFLEGIGM